MIGVGLGQLRLAFDSFRGIVRFSDGRDQGLERLGCE